MQVTRLCRTGDAIRIVVTAPDGSQHRYTVWERDGDGGEAGIAEAIERVRRKIIPRE